MENSINNKILLTAEETSKTVFHGKRSAWSLLMDAQKKRLPAIHIGNRVFFELNSLNKYFNQKLQESILPSSTVTNTGIRRID